MQLSSDSAQRITSVSNVPDCSAILTSTDEGVVNDNIENHALLCA